MLSAIVIEVTRKGGEMKKLILIFFLLTTTVLIYAEDSKTNSLYEVCKDLKSDILIVHDNIKEMDNLDLEDSFFDDLSTEELKEFDDFYMETIEIQLANTQMFSDLRCQK